MSYGIDNIEVTNKNSWNSKYGTPCFSIFFNSEAKISSNLNGEKLDYFGLNSNRSSKWDDTIPIYYTSHYTHTLKKSSP